MAAVFEAEERIHCVKIEGLALLKIIKHCHESLPHMVTGSLLGLSVGNGILEVTHAFPFPDPRADHHHHSKQQSSASDAEDDAGGLLDGHEFQLEMMRMLREVNVDNNCVGWYQSMYLGIYSTSSLLENQLSYQTDLSPNAVVILYDPMQTSHGTMVLKCYRLTDACLELKTRGDNTYIDPKNIFEEIPIQLSNPGLTQALLADVADGNLLLQKGAGESGVVYDKHAGADTTFDRLDLSTNPYLEKHLEFMCSWVDDLAAEQSKFQFYTRQLARGGGGSDNKNRRGLSAISESAEDGWASSDAPRRMESLLISNQIRSYCDQMDAFAKGSLGKLYLVGGLHDESTTKVSSTTTATK